MSAKFNNHKTLLFLLSNEQTFHMLGLRLVLLSLSRHLQLRPQGPSREKSFSRGGPWGRGFILITHKSTGSENLITCLGWTPNAVKRQGPREISVSLYYSLLCRHNSGTERHNGTSVPQTKAALPGERVRVPSEGHVLGSA